jgi:hypothetical protein
MKKIILLILSVVITISCNAKNIVVYPKKIIPESFLIEGSTVYGVDKLYDANKKTSFAFGLQDGLQSITFYFDNNQEISSMSIINGFQEKDKFYYKNARVKDVTVYLYKDSSLKKTITLTLKDQKEMQHFNFEYSQPVNKIKVLFNLLTVYKGTDYHDLCISDICFYSQKESDLVASEKDSKKLLKYFTSINYDLVGQYINFFSRSLEYQFGRGNKISISNNELTCQYYSDDYSISIIGIKGNFSIEKDIMKFIPRKILRRTGSYEDYKEQWEDVNLYDTINFNIKQNKCFVLLVPDKQYDLIKGIISSVNEWKDETSSFIKENCIPIVIQ